MAISWQRQARILAISGLYQMDLLGRPLDAVVSEVRQKVSSQEGSLYYAEADHRDDVLRLFEEQVRGAWNKQPLLDQELTRHLESWPLERIGRVEKAILRLGSYELWLRKGNRREQVLNEMVELTEMFCDPKAKAFVNGVLDAFVSSNIS